MNLIKNLARSRRRHKRNERGVAALEFAMTLPIWIALLLGGADCCYWVIANEKTDRIASSVTDIVTQYNTISIANLNDVVKGAAQLMLPLVFGNNGLVIVSSVYKPTGQVPVIKWQYAGGGTLAKTSAIGTTGGVASLPNGLTLNDNDNVIVSEVYYNFTPMFFASTGLFPSSQLYRVAMYKPRLSPLITPPT